MHTSDRARFPVSRQAATSNLASRSPLRPLVLAIVLLAAGHSAFAADMPTAGTQMQQIPASPALQKAAPQIRIQQPGQGSVNADNQTRFVVNALRINGAQAYTADELVALAGLNPGREVTLADLYGMAQKIADHYHRQGYFLAQAILPPQEIQDGVVAIDVMEGRYGKVDLKNATNLTPSIAGSMMDGVAVGDAVTIAPLERSLLLLTDLPGIEVKSTLTPGASVGASDLIVEVTPGKQVTGSIDADNAGNRYTGRNRIGGTFNLNNAAGLGDVLTLRALTSGSGLNYGRLAYQAQAGKAKVGAAYATMRYELGDTFANLQAHGTADIASVYASYPLIRSRQANLYAQLGFDAKSFQDREDVAGTLKEKEAKVWLASLNGDWRDDLGGGGFNRYSLTLTDGDLDLQSTAEQATDATTARSNGHYNKLALNFLRVQAVTDKLSLYTTFNGQLASKNLDSSEKMELGGSGAVRAYPEGEAYGDQGYVLNLEAHYALPRLTDKLPGRMEAIGFVDTGTVTLNHSPWSSTDNRRTLSGVGLGLNWVADNDFVVKALYAHKLGNAVATSAPDANDRIWLQAVKYF